VARAGLSLVLCNSGDDATREDHYLSLLQEQRASGILITPAARTRSPIEDIRRRGMPLVLVDRSSNRRQCSVSVDDLIGGELAVDHLVALGHRRITFVGGPLSTKQVADRLLGARTAAERAGIGVSVMETEGPVFSAGRMVGEQIAAMSPQQRPTAVFCVNDLIALGVLQEMTRRHISVPEDLAIVGYDDIDFAGAAAVPLTSVRQPREDLGRTAADLLIEEVVSADSHRHRQVVFEPDLIVRASTVPA
jgi:LacI family transcriptional regulator